jgi:hypothetical protein
MLWGAHDVVAGHYRRYTLDELRERIEASGFEIINATYFNTLLLPLILALRARWRLRKGDGASDVAEVPRALNALLAGIFSLERLLVGRVRLPFGVSALCLARKP